MTRRQHATARRWALRWLLIVFTMAGLGIWAGAHCADAIAALPATALNPGVDMPQFANVRPAALELAAPHVDQDGGDLSTRGNDPGDTADDCPIAAASATTPSTGGATSVHLPTAVRTPPRVDPQRRRQRLRLLPAATLAQIGVSRT